MKNKISNELMPILSKNLEAIRNNSNMNKKKFAEQLDVPASYLTEIINCNFCVSLDMLVQIAHKTGYTASQLLSNETDCFKFASTFQGSHR